jgi:BTB/POZ domain/Ankyrin repeats (3 copies)
MATLPVLGCDRWPLHYACRIGDMPAVQYCVDVLHVDLNEADTHDATPLYLAALTGRTAICRFLLERGATCSPEGDAARIFYVALTPELRNLLREWSLTAATQDPFIDLLRRVHQEGVYADCRVVLRKREEGEDDNDDGDGTNPDITAEGYSNGDYKEDSALFGEDQPTFSSLSSNPNITVIPLHKAMLALRCPQLLTCIEKSKYNAHTVSVDDEQVQAWKDFLLYLYTGRLEIKSLERAEATLDIVQDYEVDELTRLLSRSIESFDYANDRDYEFREISGFLRRDTAQLATTMSVPNTEYPGTDVTVTFQDAIFNLHSFIVCSQSDYFQRALHGSFREAQDARVDLTYMAPSLTIIQLTLQWMYTDCFLQDSTSFAVDLLHFARLLLCPRLCAYIENTALCPGVTLETVWDRLALARADQLERLEETCVEVIAHNLESLLDHPGLIEVLEDEISQIQQDDLIVDIPIAAEIKSSLREIMSAPEMQPECERKMGLLDDVVAQVIKEFRDQKQSGETKVEDSGVEEAQSREV